MDLNKRDRIGPRIGPLLVIKGEGGEWDRTGG